MLPVIEAEKQLRLVGAWTRNESSQAVLRERGFAGITADLAQFLSCPMNVVYIASPTGLHFENAAAVLQAGHHAWVEKPIATALEDVHKLAMIAETSNLMLAEAFMFPWHAQAAMLRQVLADGTLGRLRHVALTFCFPHLAPDNFRYDPSLGGGAFLDHACYLTKALDVYLGGTWTVLGGCAEHGRYAVDVAGAAQLRRDADGVVANMNWGFGSTYINEILFVGEHGRLLVESAFTKPATRPCNLILEDNNGKQTTLEVRRENPYASMITGFMQQLGKPADWPGIRQDILRHASLYFTLQAQLKQSRETT
jgi:NDP-hexose-3-ketoreductase